jgi:hypothetical protein
MKLAGRIKKEAPWKKRNPPEITAGIEKSKFPTGNRIPRIP